MKNKQPLLYYISVSLTCLLFCSVIFIAILLNKLNTDENRFNILSKQIEKTAICDTETIKELSQQRFKEDYYITQESNNTTLILSVFGVIVVFFGISSFTLFEARVNEQKKYYEQKISKQESEHSSLKIHFENLLMDVASKEGYENLQKANELFYSKHYDWFVYHIISSVKYFSDYYVIIEKRENTQSLISNLLEQQILHLNEAIDKLKDINTDIKDLEPNVTHSYIQDIQRFNSVEISKSVSKLYGKISD